MPQLLLTLLLVSLCYSCSPDRPKVQPSTYVDTTPEDGSFFDLAGYMRSEAERLSGTPMTVQKTIRLNGKEETQELTDLDFAKDLQLFIVADINKPAWLGKYATTTQRGSGRHETIRHVALDSAMTTQLIEVERDLDRTVRVYVKRKSGTVLSQGTTELTYQPAVGYDVITRQDYRFGQDVDGSVSVRWK